MKIKKMISNTQMTINCQINQTHEERKKVKQDEAQNNKFVEACVN